MTDSQRGTTTGYRGGRSMRRIVIAIASIFLLAMLALPSGLALAQDASPSAPAAEPTAPPPPTNPPAQNLGDACQGATSSDASMAPAPTGGVNDWAAGISGPVTISGWQSTGAE